MTEGNGFVSREQFLSKRPRRTKDIEIDGFGRVRVQSLSAYERGKLESQFTDKQGNRRSDRLAKLRELVAVASVVDSSGNRLFSPDDVEALGGVEAHVLEAVLKAYQELNSSDDADIEALVGN